jgi:ABC-2 type transport system permease protein
MIESLRRTLRLTLTQAWLSYQGYFSITSPFGYITSKLGFPFFLMLFFIFMGKFVGYANPLYIVIGNILLIPAATSMSGVTYAIGDERGWGTLSYVLGSTARRGPIFVGRTLFYVLDGFLTALLGFIIAALIFRLDMSGINFGMLILSMFLIAISSSGLGFLFGSISLVSRDGWIFLNTFLSLLYILVGVNFPVTALPAVLQKLAYSLPLTRGIQAARLALAGAGWSEVSSLILGEILVGAVYILIGYLCLLLLERRGMASGTLDAM